MQSLWLVLCIVWIPAIHSQSSSAPSTYAKSTQENACTSKTTCGECMQASQCSWCSATDFDSSQPRCFPHRHYSIQQCNEIYVVNLENQLRYIENHMLTKEQSQGGSGAEQYSSSSYQSSGRSESSYTASSSSSYKSSSSSSSSSSQEEIIQIQPQRVQLQLRMNEKMTIPMKYARAKDYPVDLYYLMDLSKSMEDDKLKLSALGDQLSETMRTLTSDFRLGFGSFVDKVLMPYVSTVPKHLEAPCMQCAAPYGFRNVMKLSTDTPRFSQEVNNAAVSGNLDAPEGGFDAIMQAIVCRQEIGWRDKARRLLVFSTDAGFHYAGDGKLGGVVEPNDGECHLDSMGNYTYSTIQDYPSISQVNLKVKQNNVNVIFAVTQDQLGVYSKLSKHVEGSTVAQLSGDSSNVVELVKEEYSKISSYIEIRDNATSAMSIKYFSNCTGSQRKQTNRCEGVLGSQLITFDMEIIMTTCPQDPKEWKQTLQVYPVGINESMIIELELLCSCPCEHPSKVEHRSSQCSEAGDYKCGICACDNYSFGRKCECSANNIQSNGTTDCRNPASNDSGLECSGQGNCICNVCECDKRSNPEEQFSGKYCECDNFTCDRHNTLICSGPDHGTCQCGECICQPGWTGSACDCRSSNDTCMPRNGGEICSGHGVCECGQCQCSATNEGRFSGKYCEKCPTCSGRCEELKDCVQCQQYKTGPLAKDNLCAQNCTLFTPIEMDSVEAKEEDDEYMCTYYDEDDCRFKFTYKEKEDDKIEVKVQKDRECPPKVFMLGIILGVIAAIVLIGLAMLLLWKLLTTIHDRREFAKFEKERMMAKWDTGENPIYRQATSTFKNPTYAGK